jgi:ELWxxDGT repeat protein
MDTKVGQVELVQDINPDGSSYPDSLVEFNDQLYFAADDGETGRALFASDGTIEGTQLVKDIFPENNSQSRFYFSKLSNLTEFDDKLYFASDNGESGTELFVSDGTAEGTQLVKDIFPGGDNYGNKNSSSPYYLTESNGKLYFTAQDDASGEELFVSDGTAEGTQLLVNIDQSVGDYGRQFDDFNTRNLLEFNDKLYFKGNNGESGEELFVTDGTAEGTQLVKDIFPGEAENGYNNSSTPGNFVEFNDKLYFSANDGEGGNELFVSDGTAEGTQLLVDLNPEGEENGYNYGSRPSDLVEFNGKLYFAAYDGEDRELYVSDGTAEGTQLLDPGKDGNSQLSDPDNLVEFNGKLYFTANDGVHGNELFVSDGTASGTQLVADINPGENSAFEPDSLFASNLTVVGDELFFGADNGKTGTELYKLAADDSSDGISVSVSITGSEGDDLFVLQTGEGFDTIVEFDLESDRLGLADGLQFDDLSFTGNKIMVGEEVLANLDGINTEQLTSDNFDSI